MAAVRDAKPLLLEPIVHVEISSPASAIGDITGDLAARRGQINGTQAAVASTSIVQGLAPLAELSNYQSRLNALTSGQGSFTLLLSHYEAVPAPIQLQLMAAANKPEDED